MDNGGCSDTCTNTHGSYLCSCDQGYELIEDNFTCQGRCQSTPTACRYSKVHIAYIPNNSQLSAVHC